MQSLQVEDEVVSIPSHMLLNPSTVTEVVHRKSQTFIPTIRPLSIPFLFYILKYDVVYSEIITICLFIICV